MHKVLLVENLPVLETAWRSLVAKALGNVELAVVPSITEAEILLGDGGFRLMICSTALSDISVMARLETIKEKHGTLPIIFFWENTNIKLFRRLFGQGIKGLLTKSARVVEIQHCLSQVYAGGEYRDVNIVQDLVMPGLHDDQQTKKRDQGGDSSSQINPYGLTDREREVAGLLLGGKNNKWIAEVLDMCPSTIATFKYRIFKKLGVGNVTEMVLNKDIYSLYGKQAGKKYHRLLKAEKAIRKGASNLN